MSKGYAEDAQQARDMYNAGPPAAIGYPNEHWGPQYVGEKMKEYHDKRLADAQKPADVNPVYIEAQLPGRFIDRLTSEERKQYPMSSGFLDYFPDATAAVSHISWLGNEKHNKGQPLHHARSKSGDHADCVIRHHSTRGSVDPTFAGDKIEAVAHLAERAWRAMAELQEAMEKTYGLALAPGAKP